jgi:hypothetical protein
MIVRWKLVLQAFEVIISVATLLLVLHMCDLGPCGVGERAIARVLTFISSQTKSAHDELSRDPRENPQQFAIALIIPVMSSIAPKAQRKCYYGLSSTTSKMHDFEALHHRRYASDGAVRIIVQYDDTEAGSDLFTLVSRHICLELKCNQGLARHGVKGKRREGPTAYSINFNFGVNILLTTQSCKLTFFQPSEAKPDRPFRTVQIRKPNAGN